MDILINLHTKEKKTIIVVTHDPNIASYTEETINIMDGEVVKNGVLASKYLWKKKHD